MGTPTFNLDDLRKVIQEQELAEQTESEGRRICKEEGVLEVDAKILERSGRLLQQPRTGPMPRAPLKPPYGLMPWHVLAAPSVHLCPSELRFGLEFVHGRDMGMYGQIGFKKQLSLLLR